MPCKKQNTARVRVESLTLVEAAIVGHRLVTLSDVMHKNILCRRGGATKAPLSRCPEAHTSAKRRDVGRLRAGSPADHLDLKSRNLPPLIDLIPTRSKRSEGPTPPLGKDRKSKRRPPKDRKGGKHGKSESAGSRRHYARNVAGRPVDVDWPAVRRQYPALDAVRRADRRLLETSWDALRAALAAGGRTKLDLSKPSGREALRWWCKLAHWMVRTTGLSGITHVLKTLKDWVSLARRWVVMGVRSQERVLGLAKYLRGDLRHYVDNNGACAQLSYAGRALPKGTRVVVRHALESHKDALGQEHRTPKELLEKARIFGAGFARLRLKEVPLMVSGFSESACLERSNTNGGSLGVTIERACAIESSDEGRALVDGWKKALPDDLAQAVPDCDRGIALRTAAMRDLALEDLRKEVKEHGAPRAKVTALPERGLKARVVTRSPWTLVQLAHPIRAWLLRGLRDDPRTKDVLEGRHREAAEGLVDAPRLADPRVFLSADLTAASDLLPLDLISALVDGLIEGADGTLPDWAVEILRLSTGPMLLDYSSAWDSGKGPPLRGAEKFFSRRGILMGLPTTWVLLSLVQLFWSDTAWRAEMDLALPASPAATPATVICGDDLAAWWPRAVIRGYERIALQCGAKFSEGKHYHSKTALVFTELLFEVKQSFAQRHPPRVARWERERRPSFKLGPPDRRGRRTVHFTQRAGERPSRLAHLQDDRRGVTGVRFMGAIPLRGLVEPEEGVEGNYRRQARWVNLGPAALEAISLSGRPHAVRRILRTLYPGYWSWFRRAGFEPTLPRFLGGPGLPALHGAPLRLRLPKPLRVGIAALLYSTPWKDIRSPTAMWNCIGAGPSREMAKDHAEHKFSTAAVAVRKGKVPFRGKGALLGGTSAVEDVATRLQNELDLVFGGSDRRNRFRVRPREVAKKVRSFYDRCLKRRGVRGWIRRGIAVGAPTGALRKRWERVSQSRDWYADPASSAEGFCLRLPRGVSRDLAISLGQTNSWRGRREERLKKSSEQGEEPHETTTVGLQWGPEDFPALARRAP
nr:TPA_asm: RdRp [Ampulexvirus narnaviri]